MIRKESGRVKLLKSLHDDTPETTEAKSLKIIGKCVGVEFRL